MRDLLVPIPTVVVMVRDANLEVMQLIIGVVAKKHGCTVQANGLTKIPNKAAEAAIRKEIDGIFCQ